MPPHADASARLIHPKSARARELVNAPWGALPWEQILRWPPADTSNTPRCKLTFLAMHQGYDNATRFVGRAPKIWNYYMKAAAINLAHVRGDADSELWLFPPPPTGRRAGRAYAWWKIALLRHALARHAAQIPRPSCAYAVWLDADAFLRVSPRALLRTMLVQNFTARRYAASGHYRVEPAELPTLAMVLARPHRLCPHTNGVCYLNRVATFCGLNTGVIFANLNHPRLGDLLNEWWNSSHSGRCHSHFLRNRLWEQHCLHTMLYGGGGQQRPPLSATHAHLVGQADFLAINSPVGTLVRHAWNKESNRRTKGEENMTSTYVEEMAILGLANRSARTDEVLRDVGALVRDERYWWAPGEPVPAQALV